MRCLTCQYDLSNLAEGVHRCPECGRIFDAADPQTFAAKESARTILNWVVQLAVITIIATTASLFAVWLLRTLL